MNSVEAQKGFLTFIATLVIAVGIFFATYLGVTKLNSKVDTTTASTEPKSQASVVSETSAPKQNVFANLANPENTPAVLGKETASQEGYTPEKTTTVTKTTKVLAAASVPAVLAGATSQSTSGATPATGSNEITVLLILGIALSFFGVYFGSSKARMLAIKNFEKNITKE